LVIHIQYLFHTILKNVARDSTVENSFNISNIPMPSNTYHSFLDFIFSLLSKLNTTLKPS